MGTVKVTVFGRAKPCPKNLLNQEYRLRYGTNEDFVTFGSTKSSSGKKYYRFQKVFGEDATQEQVFEYVAKPVIEKVVMGYNGTIFTYGQTGSGKTYTMTGDIEKWIEPGLIPRTIQEIFKNKDKSTVVSITYCEIYNEHVYDLIRTDKLESDLPQVNLLEDSLGITHFRNLSVHTVLTASEALNLFVRGDANKMLAETASNAKSSRSHVIFCIALDIPHPTQERFSLKPVLHLVDLAGSEKLSKCKTPMSNPWETRYINLSLHYLEQVLVALRQPRRAHIPYRNSLMTALLRNSLGGNCYTSMIATFSLAVEDIDETTHTCRFAERIALIKNEVKLKETISPQKEIDSLKKENEKLRAQLNLLGQEKLSKDLTEEEKGGCVELIKKYIDGARPNLPLDDVRKMEYCFFLMKDMLTRKGLTESGTKHQTDIDFLEARKILAAKQDPIQMDSVKVMATKASKTFEKGWRRKRNPIDLPKVNITYKRWKSTEQLNEGESSTKKTTLKDSVSNDVECDGSKVAKTLKEVIVRKSLAFHDAKSESSSNESMRLQKPVTEDFSSENLKNREPISKETFILSGPFLRENDSDIFSKGGSSVSNEELNSENVSLSDSAKSSSKNPLVCIVTEKSTKSRESITFATLNDLINAGLLENEQEKEKETDSPSDSSTLDKQSVVSNESSKFSTGRLPLTGDAEVDEEILRFYKSRYELFKNGE